MKTPRPTLRDPRLDFFRGLGMFIILIAHITDNPWTLFIPARFGFSDATEMFVFCSGMASAIAFGTLYARAGWGLGTLRIAQRLWQVYWAHLGVFFVGLLSMLLLNQSHWFEKDYVSLLNLKPFLAATGPNLIGLMTLTYVPNYFDILPMYLVILAMIPVIMALARIDTRLPVAASALLWAYANATGLNFPAEWWFANGSARGWFFNPFGWQLVFFTGFFLMLGWLPAPPVNRWLIALAVAIVLISLPFAWYVTINASEAVREWRKANIPLFDKTSFGILRYIHFLALAYLAWIAVGPMGSRLAQGRRRTAVVGVISAVGQQSLAIFMTSMVTARLFGVVLDVAGRGPLVALFVNLAGFGMIIGVAAFVAYLKRQPWKTRAVAPPVVAEVLP